MIHTDPGYDYGDIQLHHKNIRAKQAKSICTSGKMNPAAMLRNVSNSSLQDVHLKISQNH